ncbi:UPF0575 protein C19orf67 homolog isoform X1 [Xiphias gladius]|uniref:UPF0575 protein C19orf67 homolog isoform X1 n=1 Tax=Xiphias gladius TaxID=8245 RepID=UPI001A9890D9|nr:UPF0575 protein C19orf67 homolog isoform X1 [Xiphias gladius]XP_040001487.1 UPF0575 protein C19orf67 homolog isoform X1 [Xiphias gladius]XP_040001488.1 UPF0575 protein C19orf67 homolog isoform X1 [Xiphias gladius]XP_040001489.1 UPF0575 protein C19orf67 homolog isoform X1 [Xiphias gladius]XP_040001491.1 UPF0575 protein C19orf67 homolog isoform X1 [Xiphias gladius]
MTDIDVQVELQLKNSLSGQKAVGGRRQEDMSELDEPLSLLADVALAPPRGDPEACSCLEVRRLESSLPSMQLQLQFLMTKADDLHDCLVNGQGHLESDALAAAVPSFLFTCQPYFNHLQSTARSTVSQHTPLPFDIYTRLLDFSQQLCDRLEQLVLTFASYGLLCLDETEPNNMSHFCIGQSQLGRLRLTVFRYCKPAPYLARVDTGLYKRMRWNVERLRDGRQQQTDEERGGAREEREAETVGDTEYYFLCYEDISNAHPEAAGDSQGVSHGTVGRMWSIGQWVQVNPDPDSEDIYDWIMCKVPRASYHRLLFLGSDEPSSCSATDCLQQLLLSHQTSEGC